MQYTTITDSARTITTLFLCVGLMVGCSKSTSSTDDGDSGSGTGLTAEQLEHGIGPISPFEAGPIEEALVTRGQEQFQLKCSACHKLDERYVGPPLADVANNRSPAYIMNMIMNPEEMIQKHPEARALLAQFATPMANQNVAEEDARAILEYLRSVAPSN